MFTASGTEEGAVAAMREGLDDYVVKDRRHFVRLATSVRRSLANAEVRRTLEAARRERDRFFSLCPDLLCITGPQPDPAINRANEILGWLGTSRGRPGLVHPDDRLRSAPDGLIARRDRRLREPCRARTGRIAGCSGRGLAEGGVIYAAARDVTERKQAERPPGARRSAPSWFLPSTPSSPSTTPGSSGQSPRSADLWLRTPGSWAEPRHPCPRPTERAPATRRFTWRPACATSSDAARVMSVRKTAHPADRAARASSASSAGGFFRGPSAT
jgi:hypothetical protein